MRLIMSMAKNPLYLAHHYYRGLERIIGSDAICGYYHNDDFNRVYQKNILSKIQHRLLPNQLFGRISMNLEELAEKHQPDTILIFKGMEVLPSTLKKLRSKNIRLVNYNLDHPFEFHSRGSGNKNVLNAIELYDLHISYSKKIINDLKSKYPRVKTAWLPFGFALEDSLFDSFKYKEEEINALCFVGVADKPRCEFVRKILKGGFPIHVYGHGWNEMLESSPNLTVFGGVYNDDYWKTLHRYRVQLNLFRTHNEESHNMRSFEVPAVASIMLAPRTPEHLEFFTEGKEAFFFNNEEEAIKQTKNILSLPEEKALNIRKSARIRSINSGYAYEERAKQLFKILTINY